jgi:AcrR family transcriptional regulator
VTVDEIAAAADVGRMTVFNHFPRMEDMFFDRDEEGREILREACGSVITAAIRSRRYACSLIG